MTTQPAGARIYRGTAYNLRVLARRLQAGELVAVPTETVYGLAANAYDAAACRKIFRAKGRPHHDPLIVHIADLRQLDQVAQVNPLALQLARKFWPGPLTLVLPKQPSVPHVVTAGLSSVAVRMPAHPLLRRLLKQCGVPLAAPSANPFGYVSPTTAEHVRTGLGRKIRYILDGGACRIGLESTIVDLRDPKRIQVLRPGAITVAQLRQCLGRPVRARPGGGVQNQPRPLAPGMLHRHYSPRAKVVLHKRLALPAGAQASSQAAWLFFHKPPGSTPNQHVFWLDAVGSQMRAARQLYARLRELDQRGYRIIHAELAPTGPRSEAINDRLRRAAARPTRTRNSA